MTNTALTQFERDVLNASLKPERSPFPLLRKQLDRLVVSGREQSSAGIFVHLSVLADAIDPRLRGVNVEFGDIIADVPGVRHGLGFVVFVREGALNMLEGYTFGDDRWPEEITEYTLRRADAL